MHKKDSLDDSPNRSIREMVSNREVFKSYRSIPDTNGMRSLHLCAVNATRGSFGQLELIVKKSHSETQPILLNLLNMCKK
jgi:hypothetical protein